MRFIVGILLSFACISPAWGTAYFISPTGNDGNAGTSAGAPWLTFAHALSQFVAGDSLTLADGTYNGGNSGYINATCGTNTVDGTSGARITIQAANERKAHLAGTGNQTPIFISACEYWTFIGLYASSADIEGGFQGDTVYAINSGNLIFQRMLVQYSNRYYNTSLLTLDQTDNSLVEESEFYSFHRHGLKISTGSGNTYRRNYLNSRGYADIVGGYPSDPTTRGDGGFTLYPASNTIVENNIAEDTGQGFDVEAFSTNTNNKFYGNVARDTHYGSFMAARGSTLATMPQDTVIEHFVSLEAVFYGFYWRANKNSQCTSCTSIGASLGGFAADKPGGQPGDNAPSAFYTNALAVNNTTYGFFLVDQSSYGIDYGVAFNQSTNFDPALTDPNITNSSVTDPVLGTCKVWIPDGSPMEAAGLGGADIGANILYLYQDGVLTGNRVWNTTTGAFVGCGAVVAGVNDVAGSSCNDVQDRLNINKNGCSFPSGYVPSPPPAADVTFQGLTKQSRR